MRKRIAFLECWVEREFHDDDFLQWVLLVDMKERWRERMNFFYFIFSIPLYSILLSTTSSLLYLRCSLSSHFHSPRFLSFLSLFCLSIIPLSVHNTTVYFLGILFHLFFFAPTFHHSLASFSFG